MAIKCPKCHSDNTDTARYCSNCATSLTPSGGPGVSVTRTMESTTDELTRGMSFAGRYEIIEELGTGGMGRVYRAHDTKLNEEVALKIIKPEIAAERRVVERFRNEIKTARKIRHKNVCAMYDFHEEGKTLYLTMEYVRGEDLKSLLHRMKTLTVGAAISIARQIAEGLAEAHKLGIVHRDLKPGNIMIDKDGQAKIMDFGIARSLASGGTTAEGAIIGTPEYMSPEQVEGREADQRADIYSLGIILYEMLAGRSPFEGATPLSIALKHKNEMPTDPKELNPQIPRDLDRLIMKCLEKDRESRYQRAELVQSELVRMEEVVAGTTQAISPKKLYPLKKLFIPALVAIITILALFSVWRFAFYKPKPEIVKRASKTATESVLILVADFQNKTGEQVFHGAFENALSSGLTDASFVSIFPREQARKRVNQLDPTAEGRLDGIWAQLVSRNEHINVLVDGSIEKNSEGYSIEVWALDPVSSNRIAQASSTIKTRDETLKATDRLAVEIADKLKLSLQFHIFSTKSLVALKAYAEGRYLVEEGKDQEAILQYQRAIAEDPNFGGAYAALAVVYRNRGEPQLADKYYKDALVRLDRMSEREKFTLRAGYYLFKQNYKGAIEEFQALLRTFPSDSAAQRDLVAAHANLALAYFMAGKMPEAYEEGLKVEELDPQSITNRYNQSWYALAVGNYGRAREEIGKVLAEDPKFGEAFIVLALIELAEGRPAEAAKDYQQLKALGTRGASLAAIGMADLAVYEGRLAEAIGGLQRSIAVETTNKQIYLAADELLMLAQAYLIQGKGTPAANAADEALKLDSTERSQFAAAQIFIAAGREDRARLIAAELSKKVQGLYQAYAKLIDASLSLKRGNADDARRLVDEAQTLVDSWLGRFALGRVYLESNAFTEAYSEFEQCEKRKGEAMSVFLNDLPTARYLDSLDYCIGRALEGQGKSAAAKEAYQKFLKIKERADPGLAEVADAKRRLAGL